MDSNLRDSQGGHWVQFCFKTLHGIYMVRIPPQGRSFCIMDD